MRRSPIWGSRWIRIGYAPVMAARITYLGELGWELHIPTEFVALVYETLRATGSAFGITDAGYKAINSLRMEKRYLYWSSDICPTTPRSRRAWVRGVAEKGRLPWPGCAAGPERGRSQAPARMFRAGNAAAGLWRGGDVRQRQGHRHDHQRRFRPHGRPVAGLGYVPAEYFGQNSLEIEAFGRRSLATRIEGCAYDPKNERVRA